MDAMALLFALLLTQAAGAIAVSREYHFVSQAKNWTEARRYCRENFADLATIGSPEDQARLTQLYVSEYGWIGLYDDRNNWKWSLDNSSLYDNDLGDWFVFHSDNSGSQEHCVRMSQTSLTDDSCQNTLASVCYDETSEEYHPILEPLTWKSAQSRCRSLYTDLASVRNLAEMERIRNVMSSSPSWIGLSREAWKWSDKSVSLFRVWGPNEPNGPDENCVIWMADGWVDAPCSWTKYFICSTPIQRKKVVKTVLTSVGAVDPNNPQVQEAVLKHLDTEMRGQGVRQEVQLAWRKQPNGKVFNETSAQS